MSVYGFTEPVSDYEPDLRKEGNEKLKGMATETHIRIIGTDLWVKSVTFYDQKSKLVRTYKLNHLGGFTLTESELNFKGLPTKTTVKHKRTTNGIQVTTVETFDYDQMLRLTDHHHSINGQTPRLIAKNEYDPLGQLITKKVGGTQNGSDRWQEVDYKYNIRGWLTDINNVGLVLYGKDAEPPTMGDDLFAFKINYSDLNDGGSQYAEPLYNGNIAQTIWKSGDDNVKRGYVYNYDELNRLLEAQFYKSDGIPYTGAYTENLAYDLNGNITSLFRTTGDVNGASVEMDDLAYSYKNGNRNSNLLLNVSDAVSTGNTMGFVDGNTNPALDDYEYDENGNMVKDRNKGITSITYNYLNLPELIIFENSNSIEYSYNATGVKLKKTVIEETATPEVRIEVDYLDGFQYAGEVLNFFPTPEGYIRATPVGNITPGAPPTGYAYSYVYNYTDHLGNVRLSYSMDHLTGKLKILEENHYYPFGLRHGVYDTGGRKDFSRNPGDGIEPEPGLPPVLDYVTRMEYQYKYNGKEFQDELGLSWYDYGARNYDPTLGRWNVTDPMAPKYFSHSPYTYALNNPVYFIDPDGMQVAPGDENFNEDDPIVLETAAIKAKAPEKKQSSGFTFSFPSFNAKRAFFGNHVDGAYRRNMLSPENREGYIKMQQAKREGEWFVVGILSMPFMVAAAPEVIAYGSIATETWYGSFIIKTSIDATAQYAISGDVNWLNAAAGSVLPTKIRGVNVEKLSPLATEISQSVQEAYKNEFNINQSILRLGTNYIGFGLGKTANSVGTDNGYSAAQNFIFENGVQSFHNNIQTEIIKQNFNP